jgi:5'-nucleotidase
MRFIPRKPEPKSPSLFAPDLPAVTSMPLAPIESELAPELAPELAYPLGVLLTNDDGIGAPGLQALTAALDRSRPGSQVWTVAPAIEQSGCGHQITTHRPLDWVCHGPHVYSVTGSPADCTRLGLFELAPAPIDTQPSWVLAGINAGGNLGVDIYLSGTIAAVREAAIQGHPAIALSQYRRGNGPIDWDCAIRWGHRVLDQLLGEPLPRGAFWNVNFPWPDETGTEPELVFCEPSRDSLPVAYRREGSQFHYCGAYSDRRRQPGSDVYVCLDQGAIAITQLQV